MTIQKIIKDRQGSAAIEFIIVILPCLILMFLFLNVLLVVGNLMLSQSSANRTVQQVAALGCLPKNLKERVEDQNRYLGAKDVEVTALASTFPATTDSFSRINRPSKTKSVVSNSNACSNQAASLSYVVVNISYKQDIVLIPGIDSLKLDSEAISVYSGYGR
jgi:Flp pilus assembly protein TadG